MWVRRRDGDGHRAGPGLSESTQRGSESIMPRMRVFAGAAARAARRSRCVQSPGTTVTAD
eukprot:1658893-Rhodomonas_salina.3